MNRRKPFIIVLFILFFLPFIVLAEECDISKITITSMEQSGIEGNTEVISNPTYQDRNINLNLKMYEVGDSISYNMTIKNDSEEDYMIDEDTFKTDSEYIEYSLKTNDNSNVVKASSTKEVTLVITYKKEVDDSLLTNNKFDASNNLKLSMNTSEKEQELDVITTDNIKESLDPEVNNPITSVTSISLVCFVLLIAILIIYFSIYNKKKYNKYLILLLSMALIPTVYAICKYDIEVESTIEIEKLPKLYDTLEELSKGTNACITKYDGEVTDEVGKAVTASNVYFDNCADKRNVIFGGFCWQVIRTTETKGTKLIYNGEVVDGKCESTRNEHKGIVGTYGSTQNLDLEYLYGESFSYDVEKNEFTLINTTTATWSDLTYEGLLGKYTCKNKTGTCTTLYNVNGYESNTTAYTASYTIDNTNYAQIGTTPFNANDGSPAMVGYMFNKSYNYKDGRLITGSIKGNDVSYSNGEYTLLPADGESSLGVALNDLHHYTCNDTTGSCNKVRYYYSGNYYIELDRGEKIEDAINNMLYKDNVNRYNSSIKGILDAWYAQNLSSKTNMLEDTVYCNARNMINGETNGWNKDGSLSTYTNFKNYNLTTNLTCQNEADQFSVLNNNAKLTYPLGLINSEEWYYIESTTLRKTGDNYWDLSPYYFYTSSAYTRMVNYDGFLYYIPTSNPKGARPAISLKNNAKILIGNGTENNPWVIK